MVRNSIRQENEEVDAAALVECSSFKSWRVLDGNYFSSLVAAESIENAAEIELMSRSADVNIRIRVARNINATDDVLKHLSVDSAIEVREAVAMHQNAPALVIDALSTDDSSLVRIAIVRNKCTPVDLLERMKNDIAL